MPPSVAVVGAGIAGLACASALVNERFQVRVFERSRSPGGRSATRRSDGHRFDYGAQYFTVRESEFEERVAAWLAEGVVAEWRGRFRTLHEGWVEEPAEAPRRYVGVPGMSALARHLGALCNVEGGAEVAAVERVDDLWEVSVATADGVEAVGRFDLLVVAVPAPQAAFLLTSLPAIEQRVLGVRMLPTWTVMAAFERSLDLPLDGAFVHGSPLAWVARDSSKPGRRKKGGERWVLHASHEWSEKHLEEPPEAVAETLLAAFESAASEALPAPSWRAAHRWRYARAQEPLPDRCLFDPRAGVGACGDWCGGSRVEGAYLSGRGLAQRILELWGGSGSWTC